MPSLTITPKNGRPQAFSVYKHLTAIGRNGGNDVVLTDRSVADYHAQILFDGKDFQLSEVDTVADIQVNGKKKRRMKLQHGDRVLLGEVEFTFSVFDEVPQRRSEPADDPADELVGLKRLFDFSQRMMKSTSIQTQLESLVDVVMEVTRASSGFLIFLDHGVPKVRVAKNLGNKSLPEAVERLSDSILQRVIETRKPLIVSDAMSHTVFGKSASVMNLQLSSVMCAPLEAQGELLGLIYLGNEAVRGLFGEFHLEALSVFAAQGALLLHAATLLEELRTDNQDLLDKLTEKSFGSIIGTSPQMVDVFRKVEKVAPTDINVLITGETGTGKELIAREIHRRGTRHKGPFITVNCGAIPENLMESELFGHVRGAFTGAVQTRNGKFQSAHGGTLFLDEVGEMPLALQVKLLRALQERVVTKVGDTRGEEVDIRVVTATHRNLDEDIQTGRFREDLYYRLNVVNIHLPPLRDRGDDTVFLAKFLLDKYATELGSKVKGFTPGAVSAIRKYHWPGNVRQLENRIKKSIVLAEKSLVGPEDLDLTEDVLRAPIYTLAQAREDFQRRYILEVLERNGGNRTKTARDLGVDPRTIFRYLEREPGAAAPGSDGEL